MQIIKTKNAYVDEGSASGAAAKHNDAPAFLLQLSWHLARRKRASEGSIIFNNG